MSKAQKKHNDFAWSIKRGGSSIGNVWVGEQK